jgi:hypothetical protein
LSENSIAPLSSSLVVRLIHCLRVVARAVFIARGGMISPAAVFVVHGIVAVEDCHLAVMTLFGSKSRILRSQ